jgi:ERCC4-related helicase
MQIQWIPFLESLLEDNEPEVADTSPQVCACCSEVPENPHMLNPCKHIVHWDCYITHCVDTMQCRTCQTPIEGVPESVRKSLICTDKKMTRLTHADKKMKRPTGEWLDSIKPSALPATAKTKMFKAIILNWIAQDPTGKFIVYTQHLGMIKVLMKICDAESWKACSCSGDMSTDEKNQTILNFQNTPEIQLLIATVGSAGEGLNLTAANRVLLFDPWWNESKKIQAFNRVYRLMQTKGCHLIELFSSGFVEELIFRIKERRKRKGDSLVDQKDDEASEYVKRSFFIHDLVHDKEGNIISIAEGAENFGIKNYLKISGLTIQRPIESRRQSSPRPTA